MSKIIIDSALKARLNGLNDLIEFCDEKDRSLGHFVPASFYSELVSTWAKVVFTDEELEQARREYQTEGGYTTAEAIAHIEKIVREAKGNS